MTIARYLLPAAMLAAAVAMPAHADLPLGAVALDFTAQGALAGKDFVFTLSKTLKRGPVVLYFYPKAFTPGCTLEAHAFAAAMDDFHRVGATVLGLSADNIADLERFSTSECGGKFPVASASPELIKAYDAPLVWQGAPAGLSSRTTYVIGRDGKIALAYSAMDYRQHVPNALVAVRALAGK